jgi:hypothetical protein
MQRNAKLERRSQVENDIALKTKPKLSLRRQIAQTLMAVSRFPEFVPADFNAFERRSISGGKTISRDPKSPNPESMESAIAGPEIASTETLESGIGPASRDA